jgi:hypothetical protein
VPEVENEFDGGNFDTYEDSNEEIYIPDDDE